MQRAQAISVQRFLILNRVIDEDRILIAATTIVDRIPIASKSIGAWNTRSRSRLYDRGSIKITKRERETGGERERSMGRGVDVGKSGRPNSPARMQVPFD